MGTGAGMTRIIRNTDGSTKGANPRALSPENLRDAGHDNTPLLQDNAGSAFRKRAVVVDVSPAFTRHQAKEQHGSDREAVCRAANENNAPAGPVLHLLGKRAA